MDALEQFSQRQASVGVLQRVPRLNRLLKRVVGEDRKENDHEDLVGSSNPGRDGIFFFWAWLLLSRDAVANALGAHRRLTAFRVNRSDQQSQKGCCTAPGRRTGRQKTTEAGTTGGQTPSLRATLFSVYHTTIGKNRLVYPPVQRPSLAVRTCQVAKENRMSSLKLRVRICAIVEAKRGRFATGSLFGNEFCDDQFFFSLFFSYVSLRQTHRSPCLDQRQDTTLYYLHRPLIHQRCFFIVANHRHRHRHHRHHHHRRRRQG